MPVINTKRDIDKDQTRPAREPGEGRAVLAYSGGWRVSAGRKKERKDSHRSVAVRCATWAAKPRFLPALTAGAWVVNVRNT